MTSKPSGSEGVGRGRGYSGARRIWAAGAILVFFFGGGWIAISPSARTVSDTDSGWPLPFPEPRRVLGMLSLDRDVEDYLDYATRDDALGGYYRDQARISREMRPLRARYEAAFAATYAVLGGADPVQAQPAGLAAGRKPPYIAAPEEIWLPPVRELRFSHPYALDIWFQHVEKNGEAEKGPFIRALYPGIVVAAASDWSGGQGLSQWKGGGLSPAAGNGVVIYDPATRMYCSFFHLSSLAVRTGTIVKAGDTIGRGGNSGMNARKAGHGGHLHMEIFSAKGTRLYHPAKYCNCSANNNLERPAEWRMII